MSDRLHSLALSVLLPSLSLVGGCEAISYSPPFLCEGE